MAETCSDRAFSHLQAHPTKVILKTSTYGDDPTTVTLNIIKCKM
jgi:hypothetical protein